jgi:hypothetical protein
MIWGSALQAVFYALDSRLKHLGKDEEVFLCHYVNLDHTLAPPTTKAISAGTVWQPAGL